MRHPIKAKRIALSRDESATLRVIAAEKRAIEQAREARDNAARQIAKAAHDAERRAFDRLLDKQEGLQYFWNAANHELGRKAGEHLAGWFRSEYDPFASERKRISDAYLHHAVISMDAVPYPTAETIMVAKVRIPPMDWNIAQPF